MRRKAQTGRLMWKILEIMEQAIKHLKNPGRTDYRQYVFFQYSHAPIAGEDTYPISAFLE